ncbi:MAG TPA: hypothetical protein VII11_07585 [Bacteroidota bacterium]
MAVKKNQTILYIKNMVCPRCIRVVNEELTGLGLDVRSVILGEVVVSGSPNELPMKKIQQVLHDNGFELIEENEQRSSKKSSTPS